MTVFTFREGFKHIANIKALSIGLACSDFTKHPDIKRDQLYFVADDTGGNFHVMFTRLGNWSWTHNVEVIL